jgi:predicted HTH domain antitoxin
MDYRRAMKTDLLKVRLTLPEKDAFQEAAELAGLSLSAWARERLRRMAIRELEEASRPIPFIGKERS